MDLVPQGTFSMPEEVVGILIGGPPPGSLKTQPKSARSLSGGNAQGVFTHLKLLTDPGLPAYLFEEVVVARAEFLVLWQLILPLCAEVAEPTRRLQLPLRLGEADRSLIRDMLDKIGIPEQPLTLDDYPQTTAGSGRAAKGLRRSCPTPSRR